MRGRSIKRNPDTLTIKAFKLLINVAFWWVMISGFIEHILKW
jgi:hypothetical protein